MKLTQELIAQENNGATSCSLALPNRDLHEVSCLRALVNLVRLDLSHNRIQSIEALSTCKSLKWLSVARNNLRSLSGVEFLSNLVVLNGSSNQITSIKEVEGLVELRALIVNDNQINSVCKLQKLTALNTLVLSKNPIRSIGITFEKVSSLVKLSLSHCELQDLGSLKCLIDLKELRLAQNKIKHLSKDISKNSQLRIIDLGSNFLERLSDIEVLSTIPCLKNLNVRGNPLCLQSNYEDKADSNPGTSSSFPLGRLAVLYTQSSKEIRPEATGAARTSQVKTLLPNLQVLDGHQLKGSCQKRHLGHQPVLPSTTKLIKEPEMEGLHTPKKSRKDEADKAVRAGRDEDTQISDDGPHVIERRERLQKVGKAVKDRKGSLLEDTLGTEKLDMTHDQKVRKASRSVASGNDDNKPFIELINQEESVAQVVKELPHFKKRKKKDNSGLVSIIIHNQTKVSNQKKSKHHAKTDSVFSLSMGEIEVGAGGVSSWD